MKIAVIGENPNDTSAIIPLIAKLCEEEHEFMPLLGGIRGGMWDSKKYHQMLGIEYKEKLPEVTILMRDLDGLEDNKEQKKKRSEFFNALQEQVNHTGIKLLHIWELEALMFSDTDNLNRYYGITYAKPADPMKIEDPKGELQKITKGSNKPYEESDAADVCKELDPLVIRQNCRYFDDFIRKLRNKGVK
jgi:hypothetical protein